MRFRILLFRSKLEGRIQMEVGWRSCAYNFHAFGAVWRIQIGRSGMSKKYGILNIFCTPKIYHADSMRRQKNKKSIQLWILLMTYPTFPFWRDQKYEKSHTFFEVCGHYHHQNISKKVCKFMYIDHYSQQSTELRGSGLLVNTLFIHCVGQNGLLCCCKWQWWNFQKHEVIVKVSSAYYYLR